MRKIYNFIKDLFFIILGIFFGGIVGGLVILITTMFIWHGFIYAILVTAPFLIFHFTDLQVFFSERNWFGFFGRLLCLFIIGAYIAGIVAYQGGLMELPTEEISMWIFFIGIILSWVVWGFFIILTTYFSNSDVMDRVREMFGELKRRGVFWF